MTIDFSSFLYKRDRDPKNQFPTGSRVYTGFQGSGKTLSMVNYSFTIRKQFPNCKIYSNIKLNGIDYEHITNDIPGRATLSRALNERVGARGVLVLLDEAHLYFGKKSGIPLEVLTSISQQRKDRRKLVFSSQIWEELDISLRKQVKEVVSCKRFLNMEINVVHNGETLAYDKQQGSYTCRKLYTYVYKLNNKYYNRYDTYQKIISTDTNENYTALARQNVQNVQNATLDSRSTMSARRGL